MIVPFLRELTFTEVWFFLIYRFSHVWAMTLVLGFSDRWVSSYPSNGYRLGCSVLGFLASC